MAPQSTTTTENKFDENIPIANLDDTLLFGRFLATPPPGEEVVISGIAGCYPDSDNVAHFKHNLLNKIDMVSSDEDGRRWIPNHPEIPKRTGKINAIEKFDAGYFGVHNRQAHSMDPMVRTFMERAIEAIIDAGVNPKDLEGTNTGIFVGACFSESERTFFYKLQSQRYGISGCTRSMIANRVSYFLKLKGPSFVCDTACSSSLYGLEHAYRAIRSGQCDAAIVGGTNICLHPYVSLQFARLGVLSHDGSCKVFDETGNGYARSEAICALFLQKSKDSKRIYAKILHAKTNCDGYKEQGITYPSGEMQKKLLREFYEECNVDPTTLSFLEAHGTGTKVGDPEEIIAIDEIFCKNRKTPLLIGSVKSNIGHSEPTSGLCSITKCILGMELGTLLPNIHYKNPRIGVEALESGRLKVVTENTPFEDDRGLIGINSFGFGGGNCHILLKWNTKTKINRGQPSDDLPRLVCVSGRVEETIQNILNDVADTKVDAEFIKLLHSLYSTNHVYNYYRGYSIVTKTDELLRSVKYFDDNVAPLHFVFSGLEDCWQQIGNALYSLPLFAASIQRINKILSGNNINIFDIITKESLKKLSVGEKLLGSIAVQIGIVDILKVLEIAPDAIFGYSIGELICAYHDEALTLEETIKATVAISSFANKIDQAGVSYLVALGAEDLKLPKNVKIAAVNFANSTIISGNLDAVKKYVAVLEKANVKVQELGTQIVNFHSEGFASKKSAIVQELSKIITKPKRWSKNYLSNIAGQYASAEYFVNALFNIISIKELLAGVCKNAIFVEIGTGQLEPVLKIAASEEIRTFSVANANSENHLTYLLNLIGSLYELGFNPQLDRLYPKVQYPVSRGTPMINSHLKWDHTSDWHVSSYKTESDDKGIGERCTSVNVKDGNWTFINGHVIDGRNLFPATGYLMLVWETFSSLTGYLTTSMKVAFENCKFSRATNVPKEGKLQITVMIQQPSGNFEIIESGAAIVTGRVYLFENNEEHVEVPQPIGECGIKLQSKDIYKELRLRGYNYNGAFRGLKECDISATVGSVKWDGNWISLMDNMLQMQILQVDSRLLYVPTSIDKVTIDSGLHLQYVKEFGEDPYLPVHVYKDANMIKCGAIQVFGLKANSIARRKPLGEPVLEKYEFVPNNVTLNTLQSLRVNMQIALENSYTIKIKAVELVDEATVEGSEPLAELVQTVLSDLPLIQPNITILSKTPIEDCKVTVEDKKLSTETECTMVIGTNIISRTEVLQQAFGALKENGYILTREALNIDLSTVELSGINILTVHKTETEVLILLNKPKEFKNPTVINVTIEDNEFGWLSTLQGAVKNDSNVIVYAQNEPLNGVLGLINCIRREPGGQNVKAVFIADENVKPFDSFDSLYNDQLKKSMAVNVYKNGQWGTYRHMLFENINDVECNHCFVNSTVRGDLSSLRWLEGPLSKADVMAPEKCLVEVYYSSINFRDVMTASGKINNDVITMMRIEQNCVQGFEYAGRDLQGNRVMGMTSHGAMASMVEADSHLLWRVPDSWTMEEAATIPVVYGTCLYALIYTGKLRRGNTVLIHSGSGGVGQAAIQLSLHYGCTVYTTVGTQEKRDFLKKRFPQLTDRHIGNSRDFSFENMIMVGTKGRGVDVVLNSLSEEKLIATARCLARGGRFLEIGKFDLANNSPLSLLLFQKEASFHGVMLDQLFYSDPHGKEFLNQLILQGIADGAIKPLPRTVFKRNEIEQAFRHMVTGKHMGKVMIQVRQEEKQKKCLATEEKFFALPRYYCSSKNTYIILGGLGGFGLELADWLVMRGARKLVLTSRTGIKTGYQALRIRIWSTYGVDTQISTANVTTVEGCEKLIREAEAIGPVHAVFNLAVVLKDSLLENQNQETFQLSFEPKAIATKCLDQVTRRLCPILRDFVIFSSVSCGRGNAGQTNYGMANSVMERVCEQRHKDGFPALAIEWGAIGEVGLVAEMQEEHVELEIGGTLQQRISSCLNVLDVFLRQKSSPIVSSMVVAEKKSGIGGADNIVDAVANILGLRDIKAVSLHATLAELGMDSMTAVEIKQTLEREFEVFLTAQDIRSMTFARLIDLQEEKETNTDDVNKKDSSIPAMNMILRLMGDEKTINLSEINLETKLKNEISAPKVLLVPGVEGVATSLVPLTINLNVNAVGIQLGCLNNRDTIYEMAEDLIPTFEKHLSKDAPFYIAAYSFGVIVALEVVNILEIKGYSGKLIAIDGGPQLMKDLTNILEVNSEDRFQTSLICQLMAMHLTYDVIEKNKEAIYKCSNLEQRIKFAQKVTEEAKQTHHSLEHQRLITIGVYKRIKSLVNWKPTFEKLRTKIILLKAKYCSLQGLAEDYQLSQLCQEKVEVHTIEANHITVLEKVEAAEFINSIVCGEVVTNDKKPMVQTTFEKINADTTKELRAM